MFFSFFLIFSYLASEPEDERPFKIDGSCYRIFKDLDRFFESEQKLQRIGFFDPETPYNRTKSPYIYTWFRTDEAMIFLLSNNTFQVDTLRVLLINNI